MVSLAAQPKTHMMSSEEVATYHGSHHGVRHEEPPRPWTYHGWSHAQRCGRGKLVELLAKDTSCKTGQYTPASLPLMLAPPRRLAPTTGVLATGARPSVLRLAVWVDVFETGATGGGRGSSDSMSLPAVALRVSIVVLSIASEGAGAGGGCPSIGEVRGKPTEEVVEVLQSNRRVSFLNSMLELFELFELFELRAAIPSRNKCAIGRGRQSPAVEELGKRRPGEGELPLQAQSKAKVRRTLVTTDILPFVVYRPSRRIL
jgi:hypothetical protein